jgi:hypothetical protein
MSQPRKVREVYAELKAMLGDSVSSAELLECAGMMVEVANGKDRRRFGMMTPRATFDELPLDVVFGQWQWRLVVREYRGDEEQVEVYHDPNQMIDQLFCEAA